MERPITNELLWALQVKPRSARWWVRFLQALSTRPKGWASRLGGRADLLLSHRVKKPWPEEGHRMRPRGGRCCRRSRRGPTLEKRLRFPARQASQGLRILLSNLAGRESTEPSAARGERRRRKMASWCPAAGARAGPGRAPRGVQAHQGLSCGSSRSLESC